MPKFEKGDVVELKSGGPKMTIEGQGERPDQWHCCWFVDREVYYNTFTGKTLQKVDGNDDGKSE